MRELTVGCWSLALLSLVFWTRNEILSFGTPVVPFDLIEAHCRIANIKAVTVPCTWPLEFESLFDAEFGAKSKESEAAREWTQKLKEITSKAFPAIKVEFMSAYEPPFECHDISMSITVSNKSASLGAQSMLMEQQKQYPVPLNSKIEDARTQLLTSQFELRWLKYAAHVHFHTGVLSATVEASQAAMQAHFHQLLKRLEERSHASLHQLQQELASSPTLFSDIDEVDQAIMLAKALPSDCFLLPQRRYQQAQIFFSKESAAKPTYAFDTLLTTLSICWPLVLLYLPFAKCTNANSDNGSNAGEKRKTA